MAELREGKPKKRQKLEKFLDILGETVAVITILAYVVFIVNANWAFLPAGIITSIIAGIRTYGLITLLGIVGFEATAKRNIVIRIIFYVLFSAIIIFQFFPGTWGTVVGVINQ